MLRPQFTNQALSSFVLWADNKICSNGGYTNYSGQFYPMPSSFSNYHCYGAADNQIIADSSISGAIVMTGIYLNNTPISTGQSGFIGIDYKHGMTYFSNSVNNHFVSGNFSIKDFNIVLTDEQDDIILFKNKYSLRPKFNQRVTGVSDVDVTYPVIFVKSDGTDNKPYSFGGTEETYLYIKCIVLTDSLYTLHAVENIFRDSVRTQIALFDAADMPFDSRGAIKNNNYNYTGIAYNKIDQQKFMFIQDVSVPKFNQKLLTNNKMFNYDVFFNMIDFTVSTVRMPRQY